MKKIFGLWIIASVTIMLVGCQQTLTSYDNVKQRKEINLVNSWFKAPPVSFSRKIQETDYLDRSDYCVVNATMSKKAIALLEDVPIVKIDSDLASRFCDKHDQHGNDKKNWRKYPYLVRGLYFHSDTGAYSVIRMSNKLWVSHGSLGKDRPTANKQALLVYLEKKPEILFVTCSTAE